MQHKVLPPCSPHRVGTRIREGCLFFKKRHPSLTPSQRKFSLQASSSKRCDACRLHFPARGEAALALLYDLAYFYHPLPLCSSCLVQPNHLTMHIVLVVRTAASASKAASAGNSKSVQVQSRRKLRKATESQAKRQRR